MASSPAARLTVALALAATTLAACGSPGTYDGRRLVWFDDFDGPAGRAPDAADWGYDRFGGLTAGNDELQCYTDSSDNVALDGDGHLVLTALPAPGRTCADGSHSLYTSGRITTQGLHAWKYGRLEVRARVPSGVGTWPAFWALGEDKDAVGWPACGEIDVMEHVGRTPATVSGALHGPTADGQHWFEHVETHTEAPLSDGFHTFAVDWDDAGVTWRLDGDAYAHLSREQAEKRGTWVFDKPYFLVLNLAVGGVLGGPVPDTTTFPQRFVIDYVRVYA